MLKSRHREGENLVANCPRKDQQELGCIDIIPSFIFPNAANCFVNTRRIGPGAFGAAVPQPLHFKEASVFVKTHTGIASTDSSYLSVNQIQAPFETSLVLVDIGKAKIWSRIVHGRTNKCIDIIPSFIFPNATNCFVNIRRIGPGAFGAAVPQPPHFREASVFVKTHTGIASTDSSYLSVNQIQAPFETSLVLVDIGKAKIWSRIVHGRTNKSWVALT
ncbi:hypothetical protein Fcan01_24919 [Folsomia candida]|uniref:Uncharacterized protein n=1 Tax=Folsomia candida TaxID=158441 RepID=A0A226D512_FOLCA|nr:hypothetical protein Fcan01_24919 [Folsomia candida]